MKPDHPEYKRRLEALLFAAKAPLTAREIGERMPQEADIGALIGQLRAEYAGRGFELAERGGAWAFRTAPDLSGALVAERWEARRLSRAALEVLAIIAYHQPVTRAEIENIRGVNTGKGTLDTLMETGWIRPGRRRETPGRPLTWVTTSAFLDHFSLGSIMDLPGLEELRIAGLLDKRASIDALGEAPGLFDEIESDTDRTESGGEDASGSETGRLEP